jgi:sterol desaturase/sphingolipid hydroxylase (fatty acid hydroxylase superfamily)
MGGLKWLPLVLVIVLEHFILTRWYAKRSSIQRLLAAGNSAKADLTMWVLVYGAGPLVAIIATIVTVPAVLYLPTWIEEYSGWHGVFGGHMPRDGFLAILLWLLALDFSSYLSHVVMHRVPWFWHFHKTHHAATELNIITGSRLSLGEMLFNGLAHFSILTLVLGPVTPQVAFTVMFVYRVIDLLQHSDLPWDYGILGYVIASPRYHRMHHSNCADDSDANYGNMFSFWDYLFGTVARRYQQSSQIADTCTLGLHDSEETARINNSWYLAPFQATGIDCAWNWYRRRTSAEDLAAVVEMQPHRPGVISAVARDCVDRVSLVPHANADNARLDARKLSA